jgi:ABC-2 type transport system ATP-binding protein
MIRGFVAEGRTVLLSSHLLDEVEKICDAAAIVDHGRTVLQGSISEIAAGSSLESRSLETTSRLGVRA